MNNYIVRIYRREEQQDQCDRLYGVLEVVENGEVIAFRSFNELWTILSNAESIQHGIIGEKGWEGNKEKRQDHRFDYRSTIKYRKKDGAAGSRKNGLASGKLFDISRGGMRIQKHGQELKKGSVLQTWIPLIKVPIPIPVLAKVRWLQQDHSGNCQIGLQFIG